MNLHFEEDGEDRKLVCDCYESSEGEPGCYDDFQVFIDKDAVITVMCPECGATLILKGAYIDKKILDKKDQKGFQKAIDIEEPVMTITQNQADYWIEVARKDVSENNIDGAWNIQRWLKENNAIEHSQKLQAFIIERITGEPAVRVKGDDDHGY